MVAEGAACADLHSAPVSLHGDVRIEVSRGQIKKGKLRAVKLFSCRLCTSTTCWGQKTFAGHALEEVHPQLDGSACMQLQLAPDVSCLPLCSASMNLPACPPNSAKLLKLGLPRSGTDPCLSQLPSKLSAKACGLVNASCLHTPSGSGSAPSPFTSPVSHADLISTDTPSPCSSVSDSDTPQTHAHAATELQAGLHQQQQHEETQVSSSPHAHHRMLTPFAQPAQSCPSKDGGACSTWPQHVQQDSVQHADKIGTSPVTVHAHTRSERMPEKGVRVSRSMADLHADQAPKIRRRPAPALLSVGTRTYSTPLESAMSLRCRTQPVGSALTAPNSPNDSSSSGELDCSAPNTPSYPRPEATFDWSFQADRQALLGQLEEDDLYMEEVLAVGQQHLVPPLLSDACANAMDGARLIKWMSSCWWMSLV